MYDNLIVFFLRQPARLIAVGRALFHLSAMVFLAGLFGRVAVVGATAIQGIVGQKTDHIALAMLYPSLPTWWVPENVAAFGLCIVTAVAGVLLSKYGKDLIRLMAQ